MRRGPKPKKSESKAKPPVVRKAPKNDAPRVRDLEKRLAEALEREAEALKREAEALDQQTAMAEILGVISQSPTNLQPVLNTVAARAAMLCDALDGVVLLADGDALQVRAYHGYQSIGTPVATTHVPINRGSVAGRAFLDREAIHVPDLLEAPDFPEGMRIAQQMGHRTALAVPLLHEGTSIGVIFIRRTEVRLFTDKHIDLLKTFAHQAVIAIENARLFNETRESLEQQTATSEILKVISSSPTDLQPVLDAVVQSAARFCGADDAELYRLDGESLAVAAHHGPIPAPMGRLVPVVRGTVAGRAVLERRAVHVADLEAEPDEFPVGNALAREFGFRTALAAPLLRGGVALGTINLRRTVVNPFNEKQIVLLRIFADQAVIAIENVRLFTELQEKNHALTKAHAQVSESLEQQTATSEVLKVISRSTFDLQPVLDTLIENATKLCAAVQGNIYRFDGEVLRVGAFHGVSPEYREFWQRVELRPGRGSVGGRVALEHKTVHILDALADPDFQQIEAQGITGARTYLGIPMLREDMLIGAIVMWRREVRAFTDKQIDLVRTFADQAVIAIENVRLFTELQERNREVEQKSRELAAASQHKSEFLANMSHELRTPLNAIIGFSEVLTDRMFGELNEKQEEYLKDIYASGTHLLSLINDILDLSKIEAGRMELELTEFDLPAAIQNALMLVRERAGRRSLALHTNIDNRLGQIQADERKVRQVVLNLLSNAIKFTPEGGQIEVSAVPNDGFVEVSVTDTGIGIAPEDQEKVFEEFRQVGTAAKKVEGTGLGLTLCRKFVELHGGRIWVKSEVGMGSAFSFTLPVRRGE
jgi:signal transduction histidine kinase